MHNLRADYLKEGSAEADRVFIREDQYDTLSKAMKNAVMDSYYIWKLKYSYSYNNYSGDAEPYYSDYTVEKISDDAMNAIKSDVVTVCCGQAASMGAVLLTSGAKGKRCAWPNARIMIHQPLIHGEIVAPASDIQIQAEEMLRIRNITGKILAETTGHTQEEIDKDTERDNFMSAAEAQKYGLIDKVESLI